jgi:hypothetical protein
MVQAAPDNSPRNEKKMISLDVFAPTQVHVTHPGRETDGLARLFAAAIVSRQFRDALLREPEAALANGYLGQPFPLTEYEKALITSIRAESLSDLAKQVNRALNSRY